MPRFLPLAFLIASVAHVAQVAHAAPAPKGKDSAYFPTKEGDTRVYEVRVGDKVESTYKDIVDKVVKMDDGLHVTMSRDAPRANNFVTVISVTKEGLFRMSFNGESLEKPIPLLKMPAKVGTKWEVEGGATYTITKEEEVEVPAGKFSAIRVESVSGTTKTLLWFAPNVGLVKTQTEGNDRVHVLKEFKGGK